MTVTASSTTVIRASSREILQFVLDLTRYKEIDRKIVRVGRVIGPDSSGLGSVRLWGRVAGLPPAPDRQDFFLEPWTRLTFRGSARQPGRLVFDFAGIFECQPIDDDDFVAVTHAYEFTFHGPFRRVERKLGPWLQHEIEEEMTNLAAAVSRRS